MAESSEDRSLLFRRYWRNFSKWLKRYPSRLTIPSPDIDDPSVVIVAGPSAIMIGFRRGRNGWTLSAILWFGKDDRHLFRNVELGAERMQRQGAQLTSSPTEDGGWLVFFSLAVSDPFDEAIWPQYFAWHALRVADLRRLALEARAASRVT